MLLPPCDFPHTQSCINELIQQIQNLDSEKKSAWNIAEDTTNRLPHDSLMLVSLSVQSILIKEFGDDSLCTSKTDKADAKKIA